MHKIFSPLFLVLIFTAAFMPASYQSLPLNETEKQQMLNEHNRWRKEVGAAPVQWSEELAGQAQQWADYLAKHSCKMKHSDTRDGENLSWSNYAAKPKNVVGDWCSEKKYYREGMKISAGGIGRYGHYTQVVWPVTKYIGCGRARCKNGEEVWVCRYSPVGNVLKEKAY